MAFPPASSEEATTSLNEPAFNDSYAVREVLDTDINPGAPKIGAETEPGENILSELTTPLPVNRNSYTASAYSLRGKSEVAWLENVITLIRAELEPMINAAAWQAAAGEHERTREWLENRGLPKAARVAQHEAYNVLRKYGVISESSSSSRPQSDVSRNCYVAPEPSPLSAGDVNDLAQACVAMLETQGRAVEVTLSEMSSNAGGFLIPEDAGRVRERVNSLVSAGDGLKGK